MCGTAYHLVQEFRRVCHPQRHENSRQSYKRGVYDVQTPIQSHHHTRLLKNVFKGTILSLPLRIHGIHVYLWCLPCIIASNPASGASKLELWLIFLTILSNSSVSGDSLIFDRNVYGASHGFSAVQGFLSFSGTVETNGRTVLSTNDP